VPAREGPVTICTIEREGTQGIEHVWQMDSLPVSSIRKDKQDRTATAPDKRDVQRSVAGRWVDGHYSCNHWRICKIAKAI